tara:strand:+ start:704 stop:1165 length:462 start_codon:yes stop_codon:yes gene_type:complete
VPYSSGKFDFAFQNVVFHHLADEDKAYSEVSRVYKTGGTFWIYTQGAGDIMRDLWDFCVENLDDVPEEFMEGVFNELQLSVGKKYHLGDSMKADYRKTSWDGITNKLNNHGFSDFKRIIDGMDYDSDHDVIAKDSYGKEKYGEGDLSLLCVKK